MVSSINSFTSEIDRLSQETKQIPTSHILELLLKLEDSECVVATLFHLI